MKEETLLDAIGGVGEECKGSLAESVLYDMCDERLHPWGGDADFADKLRLIGKAYGCPVHEGYLCCGPDGGPYRHKRVFAEKQIAEILSSREAYTSFREAFAAWEPAFAFDGGKEDLGRLEESVGFVLTFEKCLEDGLLSYEAVYAQPPRPRRSDYALASRFLHLHRPAGIFPFDREIRDGAFRFLSVDGCRLGSAPVFGEDKSEIAALFSAALDALRGPFGDGKPVSPKMSFLTASALEYAFCCYFAAHGIEAEPRTPIALAAAVVARMQRMKRASELEKLADDLLANEKIPVEQYDLFCTDDAEYDLLYKILSARISKA